MRPYKPKHQQRQRSLFGLDSYLDTLFYLVILSVALLWLFCPIYSYADSTPLLPTPQTPTAISMLENIVQQIPSLMKMLTAIAYVMGMYFVFSGVLRLKQFGEQRTMMSSEHHLKGPLIYIGVGAVLLYLPTSVQVGMSTFWANPMPYAYLEQQGTQWGAFYKNCFLVVQLFGTLAFIRGLVILSRLGGHQGGGQGHFGKALTHMIGGIFCINIYQFVQVVINTLGLS